MTEPLVKWDASYDLGVEVIDLQHRRLIDLLNQVWEGIVQRADLDQTLNILEELEEYTVEHFTAEELYMWEINYPGFNAHTRMHREFVARIATEKQAVMNGGQLSLNLLHFLRDWLIKHIIVQDRSYADYARRLQENLTNVNSTDVAEDIAKKSLLHKIFGRFR